MKTYAPRLVPSETVIDAMLDDEALVLNVETGVYFGLSGVGARIWELLREGVTDEVIISRLVEEYAVDPDQLGQDVTAFLQTLVARGLLCVVDA